MDADAFGEGLAALVRDCVARTFAPIAERLAAIERAAPRDGRDGRDGERGRDGDRGSDGQDGRNGLSVESLEVRRIDARRVEFALATGEDEATFELVFPVPIYRGIYDPGEVYEPGDFVTQAGALWYCENVDPAKPGDGATGWRLAVKRGAAT